MTKHIGLSTHRGKCSVEIPLGTRPTSDRMAILLGELLSLTALTEERRRHGHWIPLHSEELRRLLGSRYKGILNEAIKSGYIEANEKYSANRFPKSYRLPPRYRNPQTSLYWLAKGSYPSRIRIRDTDEVGRKLVERFTLVRIQATDGDWDEFGIRQIQNGRHYATRCKYGRFHSTFTSLKRETRSRMVTHNGDPLVEVDICNSQPTILGMLAQQQKKTQDPTTTHPPHQETSNHKATPNTISGAAGIPEYLSYCEQGRIYEHVLGLCDGLTLHHCISRRHPFGKDRPLRREDVKRQFLTMLFAEIPTTQSMPLFRVFAKSFPAVADYIIMSKRTAYQHLAHHCQRLESQIVIDGAASRFMRELPNAPLLTIHDCLAVCERDVSTAKLCLTEAFGEFGVRPSFGATAVNGGEDQTTGQIRPGRPG